MPSATRGGRIMSSSERDQRFAISAEKRGYGKSLILMDLTFSELIDTVVKPYEEDEPFFIDGVPLVRDEVDKLKIIEQGNDFAGAYGEIRGGLDRRDMKIRDTTAKHYDVLMADVMRGCGRDVTSLVIRAYATEVKPRIADYLPERKALTQSAFGLFNEWLKSLNA
jgi:hypothetical protein